jgi:hypothetical protein
MIIQLRKYLSTSSLFLDHIRFSIRTKLVDLKFHHRYNIENDEIHISGNHFSRTFAGYLEKTVQFYRIPLDIIVALFYVRRIRLEVAGASGRVLLRISKSLYLYFFDEK